MSIDYDPIQEIRCSHKGKTFFVVLNENEGKWDTYVTMLGMNDAEQQYVVGLYVDLHEAKREGEAAGRAIIDRQID